jgi:type I restriction enzyme, S subunit
MFITPGDIGETMFLSRTERYLTDKGLRVVRELPKTSVVVTCIGIIGKVGITSTDRSASNQQINAVIPNAEVILPEFLYYSLLARSSELETLASRTVLPILKKSVFADFCLRVPEFEEQRKIVQILNSAQETKEARQRELTLERERKAALMEHLFTFGLGDENTAVEERSHGRSPSDWNVRLLDDCAFIQTGVAKGRKVNGAEVITVPYLRVANVQNGYLDLSEMKEITIRKSELARYQLADGDVVLTEGGDFDKLGRGFVWDGQVAPCVHQNHIFAVRPNRDMVKPDFLAYLVQSPYGRSYFLSVAHKTTNLACINKSKLGRFPVLVPCLDEQQRIASTVKACDAKISAQEQEVARLQELFDALLQELLSGKRSVIPLISQDAQA